MQTQKPPAFPPCHNGNANSNAWYALHLDAAHAHILDMAERNWDSRRFNAVKGKALNEAARALALPRKSAYAHAMATGQLLFCFHGTTAILELKGGAA